VAAADPNPQAGPREGLDSMTPSRLETIQGPPSVEADRFQQLFTRGIAGCRARDARQVKEVFVQLIGALNFDYEEAATRLFAVYEDGIRCARTRKFEEPLRILENLHAAWVPTNDLAAERRS
jgi:hypothetical protein